MEEDRKKNTAKTPYRLKRKRKLRFLQNWSPQNQFLFVIPLKLAQKKTEMLDQEYWLLIVNVLPFRVCVRAHAMPKTFKSSSNCEVQQA